MSETGSRTTLTSEAAGYGIGVGVGLGRVRHPLERWTPGCKTSSCYQAPRCRYRVQPIPYHLAVGLRLPTSFPVHVQGWRDGMGGGLKFVSRIAVCATAIICYITRGYTVWNETCFPVKRNGPPVPFVNPWHHYFILTCNTIFGICQFSLSRSILFPPLLLPTGLLSNIAFPTTSLCANLTYKLSICHSTWQYGKSSLRCNVEGKKMNFRPEPLSGVWVFFLRLREFLWFPTKFWVFV